MTKTIETNNDVESIKKGAPATKVANAPKGKNRVKT